MVSLDYRLIGSCGFVGLWCRRILRFYWTVVMQELVVLLDCGDAGSGSFSGLSVAGSGSFIGLSVVGSHGVTGP